MPVSSEISLKDQSLWVSNVRLGALLVFAREVAAKMARSDQEREWVKSLRQFEEEAWPGIDFDLEARFPSLEEKKFWARVYDEVANRIFLRQIGNQAVTSWQSSAIGDAYVIARMLTRAIQETERGWHPVADNPAKEEPYNSGPINVRL